MNPQAILDIIRLVVTAIEASVTSGKALREALADSFEVMAAKIRAGEISIDDAVNRAREDQRLIEALRGRGG